MSEKENNKNKEEKSEPKTIQEVLESFDKRLFETEEEREIGGKAIGAYIGVLSLYLTNYFTKFPEGKDELLYIIGYASGICTKKVL